MKLSQVNLDGTGVTAGGVANLIAASPHLISIRANNTQPLPAAQQSDDDGGIDEDRPLHWDSADRAVFQSNSLQAKPSFSCCFLLLQFKTS